MGFVQFLCETFVKKGRYPCRRREQDRGANGMTSGKVEALVPLEDPVLQPHHAPSHGDPEIPGLSRPPANRYLEELHQPQFGFERLPAVVQDVEPLDPRMTPLGVERLLNLEGFKPVEIILPAALTPARDFPATAHAK